MDCIYYNTKKSSLSRDRQAAHHVPIQVSFIHLLQQSDAVTTAKLSLDSELVVALLLTHSPELPGL